MQAVSVAGDESIYRGQEQGDFWFYISVALSGPKTTTQILGPLNVKHCRQICFSGSLPHV